MHPQIVDNYPEKGPPTLHITCYRTLHRGHTMGRLLYSVAIEWQDDTLELRLFGLATQCLANTPPLHHQPSCPPSAAPCPLLTSSPSQAP